MTDINIEYLPRLDLTLANNMHTAVDQLSSEKNFVVYDLNLSSSDKDILSEVSFKNSEIRNFHYNHTIPADKFRYNLQNFLDSNLVNNSYSSPLTDILENIYTASIYNNRLEKFITFEVRISCCEYRGVKPNPSWHTDEGHAFNLITLVGPTTPFCHDNADIYLPLSTYYPGQGMGVESCSNFTRPSSIGQGVVLNSNAIHSFPYGLIGDRLLLILTKAEIITDYLGHFWEIEA